MNGVGNPRFATVQYWMRERNAAEAAFVSARDVKRLGAMVTDLARERLERADRKLAEAKDLLIRAPGGKFDDI